MGVITISRQFSAGAGEFARTFAEKYGYAVIGRKEIEKRIREITGTTTPGEIVKEKSPGLLERYAFDTRLSRNLLSESILSFAKEGKVIILGRGGFEIVGSPPGVLNVLAVSDIASRVKRLADKEKIELFHAEEKVKRVDREREGFIAYFFEKKWPDPADFHISLNPLMMGISESVEILRSVANAVRLEERFEEVGRKFLNEKFGIVASANRFHLKLGIDPSLISLEVTGENKVAVHFFDVEEELREKALETVGSYFPDYEILVSGS